MCESVRKCSLENTQYFFPSSQSLKYKQMNVDLSYMMVSNFDALLLNIALKLYCAELQHFFPSTACPSSLLNKAVSKWLFESNHQLLSPL